MTNAEELMKRIDKSRAERKKLEAEIDQHFLDSDVIYKQLAADMYPAASAARMAEMRKDHAAQLDEMDRILAEEEAKLKAKETEWSEEDRKPGLK